MQGRQTFRNIKSVSVRQRLTPTSYHHDIFGEPAEKLTLVRDTPTFHSTAFEGTTTIQINNSPALGQNKSIPIIPLNQTVLYCNESKLRKQAQLNSGYYFATPDTSAINIDAKSKMYEEINQMGGYTSRIRKFVEQMSNPILSGCGWQPLQQYNHNKIMNKKDKNQEDSLVKNNQEDENGQMREQNNTKYDRTAKLAKLSYQTSQYNPKISRKLNKNVCKTKGKAGSFSKLKSIANLHQKTIQK